MIQFWVRDTIGIIALLFAGIALCPRIGETTEPPLSVVTTTSILADTVRNLADPSTKISALMGERVDPHTYKASPGDLRKLSEASIVISNGLHLEGRLADALHRLSGRKTVIAAADIIPASQLRQASNNSTIVDPHVWLDPSLWSIVSESIAHALMRLDPDRKEAYQARLDNYQKELKALHEWCRSEIGALPKERRILITAHDAFGYFGKTYDIDVHGIQGLSTDSEASVRDINRLVSLIVSKRVPAIFVESSVSPRAIEALIEGARAHGVNVSQGGELYSDAIGAAGTPEGTYIGMIRHNVTQIKNALSRENP